MSWLRKLGPRKTTGKRKETARKATSSFSPLYLEALEGRDLPSAAVFVTADGSHQGNWQGAYGGQGYSLSGGAANLPSYAQVSLSGAQGYVWAGSTGDVRALANPSGGRTAAT